MRLYRQTAAAILLTLATCVQEPGQHARDNPLDPSGTNWYPPQVVAMDDTTVAIRDTVRLHATAIDSNGTVARFIWWQSGSGRRDTTSDSVFSVAFDSANTIMVVVVAMDSDSLVSATDTIVLIVKAYPPVVTAMSDTSVGVNEMVRLWATASDTNGTVQNLAWSFNGIAYRSTARGVMYYDTSFAASGMKVILVHAVDDDQQAGNVDTIRVGVRDKEPLLYAPINNAQLVGANAKLEWRSGFYNHHYRVLFDTANPPLAVIADSTRDSLLNVDSRLGFARSYWWRVIGYSALDSADTSEIWKFATGAMPRIALLAPAHDTIAADLNVTLAWTPGFYRHRYDVLLDTVNPPIRQLATALGDTFVVATNQLTWGHSYYWRVVARDSAGNGDTSAVRMFTTSDFLKIVLLAPADGATVTGTTTTLLWRPGVYRDRHAVLLDTVNPPVAQVASLTDTSFVATALLPATTYWWRVVAIDNGVGNDTSAVRRFSSATAQGGLVAYYPFNGNAYDESGNGNNGTVQAATLGTDRFGGAGSAFSFNGSSSYIAIGVLNLNTSNSFTVTAWYKARDYDYGVLVQEWDGSPHCSYFVNFGYEQPPSMEPRVGVECPDSASQLMVDFAYNDTTSWHSMALVYDRSQGRFWQYFDGVAKGSKSLSGVYDFTNQNTFIGGNPHGAAYGYFRGLIDDVRIYSNALTAQEIDLLYHEGGWTGADSVIYEETFGATWRNNWDELTYWSNGPSETYTLSATDTSFDWSIPTPTNWARAEIALKEEFMADSFRAEVEWYWTGGGTIELFVSDASQVLSDRRASTAVTVYGTYVSTADCPYLTISASATGTQVVFQDNVEPNTIYRNAWVTCVVEKRGSAWKFYRNGGLASTATYGGLDGKAMQFIIAPSHNNYKGSALSAKIRSVRIVRL